MASNRIPADKSATYAAWDIPEVKKGQVVQAEKLRQRGPRGELLDVDSEEVVYNSITAAQLEEISAAAYEDVREQAYQEGFEQGRAEGYRAGQEAGAGETRQQAQGLREVIDQLMHYLNGQDDEVEQALVNLATCVASAILSCAGSSASTAARSRTWCTKRCNPCPPGPAISQSTSASRITAC